MAAGSALGGCSLPVNSLMGGGDQTDLEVTGSIRPAALRDTPTSGSGTSEADLAYARAAAAEVLARGGKDLSQPWENPHTGARGSVTPLTAAYVSNGATCRDFLASYLRDETETWLQGEACKFSTRWEVRSMKPWRKS